MTLQHFHDAGLVWLVNRALHPYGYALAVSAVVEEGQEIDYDNITVVEGSGLKVVRTSDPHGMVFTEGQEDKGRERFFRWWESRWEELNG